MAIEIGEIRKGMEVRTSDGELLGKVSEVYVGTDPTSGSALCDEEICSRIEIRKKGGFLSRGEPSYIPYNAVRSVLQDSVTLGVDADAARAKGWAHRPAWIGA